MEKIAILTIATGKYKNYLPELYSGIRKYFLCDNEKQIFLFSDDAKNKYFLPNLPWPLVTLLRFNYFNQIKEELLKFDLVYYIDADIKINDYITKEIYPNNHLQIVTAEHYWNFNSSFLYETNQNSTAYVNIYDSSFIPRYCQGCFFGASAPTFLKMSHELEKNINVDLKNNIIAKWHDESHLNKYILNNDCKILNREYSYCPEDPSIFPKNSSIKLIHKNSNSFI